MGWDYEWINGNPISTNEKTASFYVAISNFKDDKTNHNLHIS